MAQRTHQKKPLYRRVNRRTHSLPGHTRGGEARWTRNAKPENREAAEKGSLSKRHRYGLDYTPLYKYLLSRVGDLWEEIYTEALDRLPPAEGSDARDDPLWHIVRQSDDRSPRWEIAVTGEATLYSALEVDADGRLQKIAPELGPEHISPYCPCHTHSFNGVTVTNPCRNPSFVTDGPVDQPDWKGYVRR